MVANLRFYTYFSHASKRQEFGGIIFPVELQSYSYYYEVGPPEDWGTKWTFVPDGHLMIWPCKNETLEFWQFCDEDMLDPKNSKVIIETELPKRVLMETCIAILRRAKEIFSEGTAEEGFKHAWCRTRTKYRNLHELPIHTREFQQKLSNHLGAYATYLESGGL